MKKILLFLFVSICFAWQTQDEIRIKNFPKVQVPVESIPSTEKVWVFLMAGQSNMAGRGFVEPADTVINKRIFSIDQSGKIIYAKEPLHFYEPTRTGLDCGVSFAGNLLNAVPKNVSILMIPTAIGGSAIHQWLGDSSYRGVSLMSNFISKVAIAKQHGVIKGILWHQGESDAKEDRIVVHQQQLNKLFKRFREITGDPKLPVIIGELGSYSNDNTHWQKINSILHEYVSTDPYASIINTQDLKHGGDTVHFNSEGQRMMGVRFSRSYIDHFIKL
jgi:hypothetical protein